MNRKLAIIKGRVQCVLHPCRIVDALYPSTCGIATTLGDSLQRLTSSERCYTILCALSLYGIGLDEVSDESVRMLLRTVRTVKSLKVLRAGMTIQ